MKEQQVQLSPWAANISPSPTLAIGAKTKALKAAGVPVCGLSAGEPDFDTPDFIKEACVAALREGKTKYPPAPGLPELREGMAHKYASLYGVKDAKAAEVIISPGGKHSCYLSILATCGPGDEVIVPAPYWVSYPEMVKLAGATPVVVRASEREGFKLTPERLERAITGRTRMLIFNSPSNPTGATYTREETLALLEVAVRYKLWILSDEIYEHLLYDGLEHTCVASLSDEIRAHTLVASGFSKTFSMTGWRLGTLFAPEPVAKAVGNLQSQICTGPATFAQAAAIAALENKEEANAAIDMMKRAFDRRRIKMLDALKAMPGITCQRANGAFYLFPNISGLKLTSNEVGERLLDDEKVAIVPGAGFGDDDCIRLSYATSDATIEEGLDRMRKFCERIVNR